MTEERSMSELLRGLLPRVLGDEHTHVIAFEGKADFRRQFTKKLRAWRDPNAVFVLLLDQDHDDCRHLKTTLVAEARASTDRPVLVRIVCRSLESWLLGDLVSIHDEWQLRGSHASSVDRKFRVPDALGNPTQELEHLLGGRLVKTEAARRMGLRVDLEQSTSTSFRHFITGLTRLRSTGVS